MNNRLLEYARSRTEGEFYQEPPDLGNQYEKDPLLKSYLQKHLPKEVLEKVEDELIRLGEDAVGRLLAIADEAENDEPELIKFDAWGNRIDYVRTSWAWKKLKDIAAEEGLVAIGYEREFGEYSRIYQFAKIYLYTPSSAIYTCPLAMTDGAAKIIETYAPEALKNYFERFTDRNPENFFVSGQWMTERTGGSDVQPSETIAIHDGETWRLYGPKWFTSAITGQAAMTLARIVEERGGEIIKDERLSLFFLEIYGENGLPNNMEINKLKDKLGTRALPTAELFLKGTPAILIGERQRGVKQIATMLNITRMYNAVSTVAYMRRAYAIAENYAKKRRAFGKFLIDHPLHKRILDEAREELEECFHLAFKVVELQGKDDCNTITEEERLLLRLLTPVAKLYTAKRGFGMISEMVEAMGGAGYLEDTGIAKMLRDAQVFSIWEGTTNVLSLDVLRVMRKTKAIEVWLNWIKRMTGKPETLIKKLEDLLNQQESLEFNAREISMLIGKITGKVLVSVD